MAEDAREDQRPWTLSGLQKAPAVLLSARRDIQWPPHILASPSHSIDRLTVTSSAQAPDDSTRAKLDMISTRYSQFKDRSSTCRKYYYHERYNELEMWLRVQTDELFLLLESLTLSDDRQLLNSSFARRLVRVVAHLLNADRSILVRHDYLADALQRLGDYSSPFIRNTPDADAWPDVPTSAILTALASCEAILDRQVDAANRDKLTSILVAPVEIFGRPWGAIVALGRRDEQFSLAHKQIAERVANLIGAHVYRHWLFWNLHRLDELATDSAAPLHQRYKGICGVVADAFMSETCCLWLRRFRASGHFQLNGLGEPTRSG